MKTKDSKITYLKGRGAQINPPNRFDSLIPDSSAPNWDDEESIEKLKSTEYLPTYPKSLINKIDSPDIGMSYSMNPYQGCEHGCIYCYARNTHSYWGYSTGIDFEQKILIKENAAELLRDKLKSSNWKPYPIMLSGNTDCYQPAERKYKITRQILEVLWQYKHPVGIITKNTLIARDIDILGEMAKKNLVHVSISVTTLNESLRMLLEPRTPTGAKRIQLVELLSKEGIPVNIMMAPIIPSINDNEIFSIAKSCSAAGAMAFNYTLVRLNGDVSELFRDWLKRNYPEKYDRVLNQIEDCHGGQLNDSRFGTRMRGEGNYADIIRQQVHKSRQKYFQGKSMPVFNNSLYGQLKDPQLRLF